MSSNAQFFRQSQNITHSPVRATYIPTSEGLKLARISEFSSPKFKTSSGWEAVKKSVLHEVVNDEASAEAFTYIPDCYLEGLDPELFRKIGEISPELAEKYKAINQRRAQRRARLHALDMILCNPELDTFATFTYAPNEDLDRLSYDECYSKLRPWLSNRVSRQGLKYVAATEKQKKGGIHFHMICNKEAMKLSAAISPYTGKRLTHSGKPLYNVSDWPYGFSSAEDISGEDAQTKVAKYIFKYMTKNNQKIGGRYLLHGGKLTEPIYCYGESPEQFIGEEAVYTREVNITDNISYREWSFI